MAALILGSCYTKKKAARQVTRAQAEYPETVASRCGDWYPPKTETVTNTRYVPGKTKIVRDTLKVDCSEVGNQIVYVPYETGAERVDTVYKEINNTVENTAKIEGLTLKLAKETETRIKAESERDQAQLTRNWLAGIGAAIIIILFLILKR